MHYFVARGEIIEVVFFWPGGGLNFLGLIVVIELVSAFSENSWSRGVGSRGGGVADLGKKYRLALLAGWLARWGFRFLPAGNWDPGLP